MARQPNLDELPQKVSSHAVSQFGWMARERNHKDEMILEKIQKILKGSVGLSWNKVYSKLCKMCPGRLRSYIEYYIHLHCYEENGQIFSSEDKALAIYGWRPLFVLDGVIREIPKPPRRPRKQQSVPFILWNKRNYIYFGKVWAEVQFDSWQSIWEKNRDDRLLYPWLKFPWDVVYGRISRADAVHYWGQEIVCVRKLPCGKKLIKRLNAVYNKE